MNRGIRFVPAGDRAILAVLGDEIREDVNDRVRALDRAVRGSGAPQIVETVPSYTSLLVHYRPELCSRGEMEVFLSECWDRCSKAGFSDAGGPPRRTLVVPVCYGLHFGPDLWVMQEKLGLSRREIIELHAGRDYRVYMLGFLPGFVYLGGMDERLAFPRLKRPRLRIESGAVGIAGMQTGIYPGVSPGGWRIIGRTPIELFDPSGEEPVPVRAGDAIRFRPIDVDEWYDIRDRVRKGQYEPEILGGEKLPAEKPGAVGDAAGPSGPLRIRVLQPGVLTTVQDGGRFGHQASGVCECGAMDRDSLALANRLTGNPDDAAALELTAFGGSFEFEGDGTAALTGADMQPRLNGVPVPMNEAVSVHSGDRLDMLSAYRGMRTYLAVSGGIEVPAVLGSRSTDLKSRLGGLDGRKLRAGDVLRTGTAAAGDTATGPAEPVLKRLAKKTGADGVTGIRFVFGPQDDRFSAEAKQTFVESIYTISEASDRMGYRTEGPKVEAERGTDILSDGICFGSIQVPADGRPIVMMADHQTTGGYAKIGTVLSCDLPLLAQLGPGKKVRFVPISS